MGRSLYQDSLKAVAPRPSVRKGAVTPIPLEVVPPKPHVMAADPVRYTFETENLSLLKVLLSSLPLPTSKGHHIPVLISPLQPLLKARCRRCR